jgi:hypothetical protein
MRFSTPSAFPIRRVGMLPRFHPKRLPPRPFSGPRGFDPHRTWQPCFMLHPLMGFSAPQGFSLPRTSCRLVACRFPLDVSRSVLVPAASRKVLHDALRPQGIASRGNPLQNIEVFHPMTARCLLEHFIPPPWYHSPCLDSRRPQPLPPESSIARVRPSHPLVTFFDKGLLAHPRRWPPASSHTVRRPQALAIGPPPGVFRAFLLRPASSLNKGSAHRPA